MKITRFRPLIPSAGDWMRSGSAPLHLDRLFDEFLGRAEPMSWAPAVDIMDRDGELLLTAEMPGMTKDDVQLEVGDGVLTLRGEKRGEMDERAGDYRLWERSFGAFERTFSLPRSVAADRITAEVENGVLKVHMPKTEKARGKRVAISGT